MRLAGGLCVAGCAALGGRGGRVGRFSRRLATRTPSPQALGLFEDLQRTAPRPRVEVFDLTGLGALSYAGVMDRQRDLVDRRLDKAAPGGDALILVEHTPVYTLGRGATLEHVLFDADAKGAPELVRVERGGDVTYHGPGQLVAYPILDLRDYKQDSHWYLRALEETVIRTCDRLGAAGATRHSDHTGVWLQGRKVAAAGVALRRWVTFHGIALNVNPDMAAYDRIVPCGLDREPVGALSRRLPGTLRVRDVVPIFLSEFEAIFDADLVHRDPR